MIRRTIVYAAMFLLAGATFGQQRKPKVTGPWMDRSLSPDERADLVAKEMSLDEKISLVHGMGGFDAAGAVWNGGAGTVQAIPRLGIPYLQLADSAVGVREAAKKGRYSTLLPSVIAAASSWDTKAAFDYGALIGRELRDELYNTTLGGGVDITREPRNGRNFEYAGEDPVLAGKTVAQVIQGVNSEKIISDVKHYAFNDQETGRDIGNVILDKRAMRETDLLAFEIAVLEGKPGMVMCSYNKVNGDWACENDYLLNQVLKKSWNFPGFVVSDWEATHTTAKAALAGLDNEQPGFRFFGDSLKGAVQKGEVPATRLDDMVHRILRTEFAAGIVDDPPMGHAVDPFGGAEISQRIAEESIVLLKNERDLLPLPARRGRSIVLIGSRANKSILSGGGSAQVDPPGGIPSTFLGPVVWFPSSPMKQIQKLSPEAEVSYDDGRDVAAAAESVKKADVAIVFVNQPMTEARDAKSLRLPKDVDTQVDQDELVSAVAAANKHTIVVLETGGPVAMPWANSVDAIIEAWYPGVNGAQALANILFGEVAPSAKLPVTFAKQDSDLPHPEIAGIALKGGRRGQLPPFDIPYTEGLKVGYKWFDAENKEPLFPFGYGLTYTKFGYSDLQASLDTVSFTVRNTGKRAGVEIAQVYAGLPSAANEPPRRLVAWQRVPLEAGESKTIQLRIEPKFLSIFNVDKNDWELLPGQYKFSAGGSSRSLPLTASVQH